MQEKARKKHKVRHGVVRDRMCPQIFKERLSIIKLASHKTQRVLDWIMWPHVYAKGHEAFQGDHLLMLAIGIETYIEVIVVSLTTLEAHQSPRAKPEGYGELHMSLMKQ